MLPVEKIMDVGLRQIISKGEVKDVLAIFEDCEDETEENWNRRYAAQYGENQKWRYPRSSGMLFVI